MLTCYRALIVLFLSVTCVQADEAETEWHHYGNDLGGTRYSLLDQINVSNVATLQRAWTFRTGDIAEGSAHYAECTPLVIDGVMYVITPFSRLIAVDATSGKELWRFTPDPPLNLHETTGGGLASRGLGYSTSGTEQRIFLPVRDGRLYCINIATHQPDPQFNKQGYIDLRAGLPDGGKYLFLSSPPVNLQKRDPPTLRHRGQLLNPPSLCAPSCL